PVIGYRSFGEDRETVARLGLAYMKGMQDAGIMACAKHFPGHGDVDVDSHYDLPVIKKKMEELDSMELYPFRALFQAGVGSVMIAHLYIPAIDATANRATSLSRNNVTGLLRNKLNYQGLTFTDALEMKGVAKFFPQGTIAVEALMAGNDMLCLPASVPETIEAVKKAIEEKKLNRADIFEKTKKVLAAKYDLGLHKKPYVELKNLLEDLNASVNQIRYEAAQKSITLLRRSGDEDLNQNVSVLPVLDKNIPVAKPQKMAYVGIGINTPNEFARRMQSDFGADIYTFGYKEGEAKTEEIVKSVIRSGNYHAVITGIHNFSLRPAENFGISASALKLYRALNTEQSVTLVFGNVLAVKNFCDARNLIACYQDDSVTQHAAADYLSGKFELSGRLPVSVCGFRYGYGLVKEKTDPAPLRPGKFQPVDSIIEDAIAQQVFPGCVAMAVHEGEIAYYKSFGHFTYEKKKPVSIESIFDLASVTKTSATTLAVMKLYEQGRLDLKKTLGDYLPFVKGTDKARLRIDDILLHQAGLVPFIPFYKETIDSLAGGIPRPELYRFKPEPGFTLRVAEGLYLRNDWEDTLMVRILQSPLGPSGKYVYSDNDFIFLGKIVEQISGMRLDEYLYKHFYRPMGLITTGFRPGERFGAERIVPTETEKHFRRQKLQGDVHDEGAALFGGVAGHAGLFSTAYDLAVLYQMLLNGGEMNGVRYLKKETIQLFTSYQSAVSRRGLGFDKPEKDNALRKTPYPSSLISTKAFGHTGFTGTCVWADPEHNIIFIFLSNRVHPTRENNKLNALGIRGKIHDAVYRALGIS
ncbi:MAG: serine hydrolase, partial [Chitinophagaceae bacterium]|nr:serine hydrolase [Chitinophagaceae bacterium]